MTDTPLPVASFANTRKATHIFETPNGFFWIRTFSNNAGFQRDRCVPVDGLPIVEGAIFDQGTEARNGLAYSARESTPVSLEFNLPDSLAHEQRTAALRILGNAAGKLASLEHAQMDLESSRPGYDVIEFLESKGNRPFDSPVSVLIYEALVDYVGASNLESHIHWFSSQIRYYLCHGEFSFANIVRDENNELKILSEKSLPVAPQGFDAGWLLGDLYENAMSPIGVFDEISAIQAGTEFLLEYAHSSGLNLEELSNNLHQSFLLRLIHHYVQFRISAHSSRSEEYFLEAIRDLHSRKPFTFSGELFGVLQEGEGL